MIIKTIDIDGTRWANLRYKPEWQATYKVSGEGDMRYIQIDSRSGIIVIVARHTFPGWGVVYYISSPNFSVALPGVGSMDDTGHIIDKLIEFNMTTPDAITIGEVLRDMGNF